MSETIQGSSPEWPNAEQRSDRRTINRTTDGVGGAPGARFTPEESAELQEGLAGIAASEARAAAHGQDPLHFMGVVRPVDIV